MMKNLEIQPTNQTPLVKLNAQTGKLFFSGRSLPEDSAAFYKVVFEWISQYIEKAKNPTQLTFNLEYFNTASAKAIFSIFNKFEEQFKKNKPVSVSWCYDIDDEDMRDLGLEYCDLFTMPIELIVNKSE